MTKFVKVGDLKIGSGAPIVVQSMTNTDTKDVEKTVKQIKVLKNAGCKIVRLSVYDGECVEALKRIKKMVSVPLVADIHFDYKLAISSIKAGVDKIRINPGNIGAKWKVKEVARAAADRGIPIRVGANMGSIDESYLKKFDDRVEALVKSAMDEVETLESLSFDDIVVAVKSSDAVETVLANEKIARLTCHPIHLGVTEAGVYEDAVVKSAFAIGHLVHEKIGDTVRVSIAGDPLKEVATAYSILKAVHALKGIEIIACPTCARTEINVENLAEEIKNELSDINASLKVAVMGCVVNGVGEARDADIAVFGTKSGGIIYEGGTKIGKVKKEEIANTLKKIVERHLERGENNANR